MPKIDSGDIKNRARRSGISMKQLAKACQVPYGTLMQYLNDFVENVPQHIVDAIEEELKRNEN